MSGSKRFSPTYDDSTENHIRHNVVSPNEQNSYYQRDNAAYFQPNGLRDNEDTENLFSNGVNHSTNMHHQIEKFKKTVVVIGTGDLGKALVSCLIRAGYRAVVASRNPEQTRFKMMSIGGEVENFSDAVSQSEILLLAIPCEGFSTLSAKELEGKILVDVSNRPPNYDRKKESIASTLQGQLPESIVVKAFNTLSAYSLQNGTSQGSKEVPICSDNDKAKAKVISLARDLGFVPVDFGRLSNAKDVEDIPLAFFKDWKLACKFAFIFWPIAFIYSLFRHQLCINFARSAGTSWMWSVFITLPVETLQLSFGHTSLTLLASCYFPGVIAAYLQLYRGTKYSEFPKWLDTWLKGRKYIGLMALLFAGPHFILAIITKMYGLDNTWNEAALFAAGTLGLTTMVILGVTSLPSVSASLTWREFSFVQRYLGWLCLWFSTFHIFFMTWGELFSNKFKCIFLPDSAQIIVIYPAITILLKLPLIFPLVDNYLQKIRRGYERPKK